MWLRRGWCGPMVMEGNRSDVCGDFPMNSPGDRTDGASEFSSHLTKRLCIDAEALIDAGASGADISAALGALADDVDTLTDEEREQLQEVLALLSSAGNVDIPTDLNIDGEFATSLSDDRMFLTLAVRPPIANGKAVEASEVINQLRETGLQAGVDVAAIRDAVKRAAAGEAVADVVIVRGAVPKPGRDGSVRFFARRGMGEALSAVSAATLESGDQTIWMCREGDRIGKIIAPEPGQPGYDAAGQVLSSPSVKPADVSIGQNVAHDGDELLAKANGVVRIVRGVLTVAKTLILRADVTASDGEVVFDGDVHVHGAVRSGATIRTTGEVIVHGVVEAATIESTGGDIHLQRGISGQQRGVVRAAGDIRARFAEQASLHAGGDVQFQVGTMYSRVQASGTISAVQGKGQLIGGLLIAGHAVTVKELGAPGGARTQVIVGLSTEGLRQIDALACQRAAHLVKHDAAQALAEQMHRAVGDIQKLTRAEIAVYARLRQTELLSRHAASRIEAEIEVVTEAEGLRHGGLVEVFGELQPGVDIRIGPARLANNQWRGPCTITVDKTTGRIKIDGGGGRAPAKHRGR